METAIIIPARYGSSRFPGKPLATIRGVPMIERVYRIAARVPQTTVYVATDDDRIAAAVSRFGGRALMTNPACRNGTERVYAAAASLPNRPDVIINLQGDSPLSPPWIIEALVHRLRTDETVQLATPAVRLTSEQYLAMARRAKKDASSGTLVTFDQRGRALYFSKSLIPHLRADPLSGETIPVFKHIGIYGYRWGMLERYLALQPTPLEQAESLEQLRALEHGIPIHIVQVDYRGRTPWSVDTQNDLRRVEEIIEAEGEL